LVMLNGSLAHFSLVAIHVQARASRLLSVTCYNARAFAREPGWRRGKLKVLEIVA